MICLLGYFNLLWLNDAIWRHTSGSALAQVMTSWLTALSHNLNQCWLLIGKFCGIHLRAISQWLPKVLYCIIYIWILYLKSLPHLPEDNELFTCFSHLHPTRRHIGIYFDGNVTTQPKRHNLTGQKIYKLCLYYCFWKKLPSVPLCDDITKYMSIFGGAKDMS